MRGTTADSVHRALLASGALRRLPRGVEALVCQAYADPLRNRSFAFLDAAFGPEAAVAVESRLRGATVGIVGCGGIGSAVAYLLAGMGTRRFHFVDPDVVEEGNLSRQVMYTLESLGRPKVEALAEALGARFRALKISTVRGGGLGKGAIAKLSRCNFVICAGDDPPTLGSALRRRLPTCIPLWTCGYTVGRSIVRSPEVTKKSSRETPVVWSSLSGGFAPSSGLQNLEIAAACVWLIAVHCGEVRGAKSASDHATHFHDYTGWKRTES